jgi:hypothetical protein
MSVTDPAQSPDPTAGAVPPMLHNLVYCSRATPWVDDAAVERIVAAAQRHNPAHGITGMLVFGGGLFFQWLEGPRAHIEGLMALLQSDSRHEGIVQLSETEELRERLFPDWAMERVGPEDVRVVLLDALDTVRDARHVQSLQLMLSHLDSGSLRPLVDA